MAKLPRVCVIVWMCVCRYTLLNNNNYYFFALGHKGALHYWECMARNLSPCIKLSILVLIDFCNYFSLPKQLLISRAVERKQTGKKVSILMSLEVKYHLTKANVWPKGWRYFCHWKWTFHGEILKSFLLILSNSISFSYPVIIRSWDGVSPGFFFSSICLQESLLQIRPMLTRKINTIRCIFFSWLRLNAEACFWALLRWK